MGKDFWRWHTKKEKIDEVHEAPFFQERQIWFCHLGVNVGSEQDGVGDDLRPVVIIRKFNKDIFWGIPLTRTIKKSPYYFAFQGDTGVSSAILSQIRLIDARRLSHQAGWINEEDFVVLIQKFKALLP